MKRLWLKWALIPLFALILGACSVLSPTSSSPANSPSDLVAGGEVSSSEVDQGGEVTASPEESSTFDTVHEADACKDPFADGPTPSFRTDGWKTNFCLHSVPYDEIFSGGPPRDGIPPIDSPNYETTDSADNWLEDPEPVIILNHNGDVRAYPLQILIWHEIVNDQVGGDPVVVTFCPLCNTALVFIRPEINGEVLDFGTSGNLRYSDLVMWDRQTESWWQQFSGDAIVGDLTGTKLESLPAAIISWDDFKAKHPEGQVLSVQTGFPRSYGRNPYPGYDNINSYPFAFDGNVEDELPVMARVVGVRPGDGQGAAYSLLLLQEELVLNEVLDDLPIAVFWKAGTASAVDNGNIAAGRDVGATGVFLREVEGEVLSFNANGDGTFTDQETGSTWDILGLAIGGSMSGTQLEAIPHHDTFWFAWAAFVPDTTLSKTSN
jgi:hypothetical protein